MVKRLQVLLPEYDVPADLEITGLCEDSRAVEPGDAFVAVRGEVADGHRYIPQAIARGAVAVLCEEPPAQSCVPTVVIADLKGRRGSLARRFYDHPSAELRCFGVTGTNGKTSIAHFIAQLLEMLGQRCGYLGTVGWGLLGDLRPARLTTVDAITLQKRLRALADQGARAAALEVSSHALSQGRVDEVAFDTAIFSNLSRDHLDYHPDFQAYGEAKARLFAFDSLSAAVINADDAYAPNIQAVLGQHVDAISYGRGGQVRWSNLQFAADGITGRWHTPWGEADLALGLAGEFSVANVAAAVAALCHAGHDFARVVEATGRLSSVPGRMEFFHAAGRPGVVVDYAHTPDALDQALAAARRHTRGRLLCVFGCGGDRDPGKRPLMARAAEARADEVWLTSDNPRSENPDAIIDDMVRGLQSPAAAHRQVDRQEAISAALARARPNDLLLVAGRGHETHQEVAGQRVEFNDREVVARLLGVTG